MQGLKLTALMSLAILLMGCSKTVQWEEEVPLNTGEVIWVKRSKLWVYKGGFGNPFDMAMRPTGEQTIRFKYAGIDYSFTGRAQVGWIAIAPDKTPMLIGIPGAFSWHSDHAYYCVIPYYVQFIPDKSGTTWTWPEKIEPWLYNLPANIMASTPGMGESLEARYTAKDRDQRDQNYRRENSYARVIDPLYDARGACGKKYDPSMKPNWSNK